MSTHYTEDSWDRPLIISKEGKCVGVTYMKTVCAWCGKLMSGEEDAPQTSHGICKPCILKESGGEG